MVPASLCPRCGGENRAGAVFCDQCGTRLPTGPAPRFGSPQSYTPKHLVERILTSAVALEASIIGEASISAMGLGLAVRLSRLADGYLIAGRFGDAAERARSAVGLALKHNERANEALALRTLADVVRHTDGSNADAAVEYYETGLAIAARIGMRPLIAHLQGGLGMLYAPVGKRDQATELLASAAAMYRELGMTGWLERFEQAQKQSRLNPPG